MCTHKSIHRAKIYIVRVVPCVARNVERGRKEHVRKRE
jgi:iron only hydrogenase large subunit-like protein